MIHLSRFIIGIRHNRIFRMKTMSGDLVDRFLKIFPDKFDKVNPETNGETILVNSNNTLLARFNLDDIIFECRKLYDFELGSYVEIKKNELVEMASLSISTISDCLKLSDDFIRIGIVFDFKIPRWESLKHNNFNSFIEENFINFPIKESLTGQFEEISESNVRLSYKLRVPGGGVIKKLEDFRNIIIKIEESKGFNEKGKEEKCLFISADIQHIFKPPQKSIHIKDHYNFAFEHLKSVILPVFNQKGIEINYE